MSSRDIASRSPAPPPSALGALDTTGLAGATVAAVSVDGEPWGVVVVADTVKPTSAAGVAQLRDLGLEPILLTGDNAAAAAAVADAVGITRVEAEAMPDQKLSDHRAVAGRGPRGRHGR